MGQGKQWQIRSANDTIAGDTVVTEHVELHELLASGLDVELQGASPTVMWCNHCNGHEIKGCFSWKCECCTVPWISAFASNFAPLKLLRFLDHRHNVHVAFRKPAVVTRQ
jgi:hypothetical protein